MHAVTQLEVGRAGPQATKRGPRNPSTLKTSFAMVHRGRRSAPRSSGLSRAICSGCRRNLPLFFGSSSRRHCVARGEASKAIRLQSRRSDGGRTSTLRPIRSSGLKQGGCGGRLNTITPDPAQRMKSSLTCHAETTFRPFVVGLTKLPLCLLASDVDQSLISYAPRGCCLPQLLGKEML